MKELLTGQVDATVTLGEPADEPADEPAASSGGPTIGVGE